MATFDNEREYMNLYWVTTEDHHEDWFIVALTSGDACQIHEKYEGYDPGDAKAEKVMSIPKGTSTEPGWPTEELLVKLGAKFLQKGDARVVEIKGRKFSEGMLESLIREITDNQFEAYDGTRPNKTRKSTEQ